ncbi:hypothetical protein AAA084_14000, partial [Dorea longicatena]|uniref:hypothetical protein n=1 Tax=Dorea longicatena TaxID=88431 RepID=UPI0032C05AA8
SDIYYIRKTVLKVEKPSNCWTLSTVCDICTIRYRYRFFTLLCVQEEIVCNPNIYNEQQAAEFAGDL